MLTVAFLLLHAPLHYNHLVVFPVMLAVAVGAIFAAFPSNRLLPLWALLPSFSPPPSCSSGIESSPGGSRTVHEHRGRHARSNG